MLSDLKFALRSLRKCPGFTLVVVLTLALGVGVNTAVFSLFDQVLLRALPVPEPQGLVDLSAPGPKPGAVWGDTAGSADDVFSYPMFHDLERLQRVFTGIAAHHAFDTNLTYGAQVSNGKGLFVSGSYFAVLGVRPAVGRLIGSTDDVRGGPVYVAVLSYDYWLSRFSASPGVLGSTLRVNGQDLAIIGVAPRGFAGTVLGEKPQIFVPITLKDVLDRTGEDANYALDSRSAYWVSLFARLKPGVSIEQARVQIDVPYRAILNEVEAQLQTHMSAQTLAQFRSRQIGVQRDSYGRSLLRARLDAPLKLLLGVAIVILLIACANIANLLLVRALARSGEIALRVSLGATPRKILAQLLAESVLLAVCGGVLGVVLARWSLDLIALFLPDDISAQVAARVDGAALLFAVALALGAGLAFGLAPALLSTRDNLHPMYKGQGTALGGGRGAVRTRTVLIASQTVMAMMLLVSAGLLIESLYNIGRVDLGLRVESLATFRVSPSLNGYTPERAQRLFERLEDELAAMPGITGVTASLVRILADDNICKNGVVQGYTPAPGERARVCLNEIGAGYFHVLGVPVLAGREFTRADVSGTGKVAIVNEELVRQLNLGPDAIGKWMSNDGSGRNELDTRIVGVVRNMKYGQVKEPTVPQFFLPYRQDPALGALTFYVRAQLEPQQSLLLAAKAVARLDPSLPIESPKTLARQVAESVSLDSLLSTLCAAFAVLAVFLAAIGLYGALAHTVAQRVREIGVRMALGARPGGVAWTVLRDALRLAGVGVVVGGLAAWALARFLRSLLFGVQPGDPAAWICAAVLLLVVAALAAWIPAWRAARVDPMVALRAQ